MSDATIGRMPVSTRPVRVAIPLERGDDEGGEHGQQHVQRAARSHDRLEDPDDQTQHGRRRDLLSCGTQDQAQPDAQDGVADHVHDHAEPGGLVLDLVELGDRVANRELAVLGGGAQALEGGDLVEPVGVGGQGRDFQGGRLAAGQSDHDEGRERADPHVGGAVSAGDALDAALHVVDGQPAGVEGRGDAQEEEAEVTGRTLVVCHAPFLAGVVAHRLVICLLVGSTVLWLEEIRKVILRRRDRASAISA